MMMGVFSLFTFIVVALPKPDPMEIFSSYPIRYADYSYYSHTPLKSNFYTDYRAQSNYY